MKRFFIAALCALMAFGIFGCAKAPGDTVIAAVNKTEIRQKDFEAPFNMYLAQYSQAGYDMQNAENLKALQDSVFNALVRTEVIYQQAAVQGFALSDEEKAGVAKEAQAQYDALLSSYVEQARANGSDGAEAAGNKNFEAALKAEGFTAQSFLSGLEQDMQKSALAVKLEEQVKSAVTLTEEDAKARYETELSEQRAAYQEDPSAFETAQSAYDAGTGSLPLYVPEGFVRVKHILVEDEAAANDLIKRIDAGEDFDALMAEYGTDPGMQAEPNKTLGYLLGANTSFVPEFKAAGLALANVGDHSAPIKSQFGYHIIKLVEQLQSGDRAFEDIKADYMPRALQILQREAYEKEIERWTEEADIVSYIGRIRSLGAVTPAP
ncbi:MAG TPA: SurA N-terminal domain-containing protein [Feifaniaceae bacterium]|nr:SurA N-terminal domain-containing protein [Feifaniaceae bacterium]